MVGDNRTLERRLGFCVKTKKMIIKWLLKSLLPFAGQGNRLRKFMFFKILVLIIR